MTRADIQALIAEAIAPIEQRLASLETEVVILGERLIEHGESIAATERKRRSNLAGIIELRNETGKMKELISDVATEANVKHHLADLNKQRGEAALGQRAMAEYQDALAQLDRVRQPGTVRITTPSNPYAARYGASVELAPGGYIIAPSHGRRYVFGGGGSFVPGIVAGGDEQRLTVEADRHAERVRLMERDCAAWKQDDMDSWPRWNAELYLEPQPEGEGSAAVAARCVALLAEERQHLEECQRLLAEIRMARITAQTVAEAEKNTLRDRIWAEGRRQQREQEDRDAAEQQQVAAAIAEAETVAAE